MWAVSEAWRKEGQQEVVQSIDLQEHNKKVSLHQKFWILHHYQRKTMLSTRASTTYLGLCKNGQILLKF